eukprot:gene26351-biopygen16031
MKSGFAGFEKLDTRRQGLTAGPVASPVCHKVRKIYISFKLVRAVACARTST